MISNGSRRLNFACPDWEGKEGEGEETPESTEASHASKQ